MQHLLGVDQQQPSSSTYPGALRAGASEKVNASATAASVKGYNNRRWAESLRAHVDEIQRTTPAASNVLG